MRMKDKVVLVTGASRGIGKACAERFAQEGAKVVLADVNDELGEKEADALRRSGGEALYLHCDVGDKAEVQAMIDKTVQAFGRIDCVIANAGIVHAAEFLDLEEEDFDRVIRVNLKGVFLTGQLAAKQMVKQGGGGTIINMSSVNDTFAIPSITPYVAAKGGVKQLTKVMALALADYGIRVNAVGPGSIATELAQAVLSDPKKAAGALCRTPMGRFGEPSEVASVALFLASEDSSYLTGHVIYPDGGRMALNYTVPVKPQE